MVGRQMLNIDRYKDRGFAAIGNNRVRTQQFTHTLSYNKNITPALSLNAVLGYEYMKFEFKSNSITAQDFDDIGVPYYNMLGFSSQSSRVINNFEAPTNELQSYFGRAAFSYNNKYLLTMTLRADGSTKFGENNKYGYFPSFSAAWNISNENFMKSVNFVQNLKLRAGWGQTGNQEFPAGAAQDRYAVNGIGSTERVNVGNKDLKWETSTTFNAGLDVSLVKNKINLSVDYFNKETEDVLFEVTFAQPGPQSAAKQWKNFPAIITNKGLEVTLNSTILNKGDMNWNFGINAAWLKNQIDGLNGTYNTGAISGQGSTGAFVQKLASGYPLNVYYLRHFEGIDKTTGQSIYTEDGDVSYYGEDPNPNMLLGISTDFSYKKFSLGINMNGAFGHYIYNNTATSVVPITNLGTRNVVSTIINSAIKEDLSNPISTSDRYLEKGNYLKLANATLSYNLGKFVKFIRNSSISLTGQNLFVLTDFSGFDPEVNVDKNIGGIPSNGIEYIPYPTARRFIFSINFGF